MSNRIYGWFADASDTPVHNPPLDAPCLFCGEAIFEEDVRTISLMWSDRSDGRSYFYRVHQTCHNRASPDERGAIDGVVFNMIGE